MWMQGEFTGVAHPFWLNPPGYGSASRRLDFARLANDETMKHIAPPFEDQVASRQIVAGSPETVIRELRVVLETCRPGLLMRWANDGGINDAASKRCIELLGTEVLPALRTMGAELELYDPFELDTPVSLKATPPDQLTPVSV